MIYRPLRSGGPMKNLSRINSCSIALGLGLLMSGCATDQAAKVRSDKPATVGIWGAAYRPTANVGVVGNLSGLVSAETNHQHVDETGEIKSEKSDEPGAQNIKSRGSQKVDLGLHLYPSQKSAFFFGIAANKRKNQTEFETPNEGSSLASPSFSNVQVSDDIIAVGPSVGWDWIWTNGVSLLVDVGPRWDVSRKREVTDDSTQSNKVDVDQRDKLLKKIDNSSGLGTLLYPQLILGYSF